MQQDYREKDNVTTEARGDATDFKDGGRDQHPRDARNAALEAGEAREQILPSEPRRVHSPTSTLILAR